MSDPIPIVESLETAAERSAAAPQGPVPGRLDLDRSPEAAPPTAPDPTRAGPARGLTEAPEPVAGATTDPDPGVELPRPPRHCRGRRLVAAPASPAAPLTPQQRLLLLDTWQRSGLPADEKR